MSTVSSFDTQSVRAWDNPQPDSLPSASLVHVAPPRLPHGLRELDIGLGASVRVQGTIENIQKDSAVYHVSTWLDTKVYSGILDSLNLAPANLDILCSEHKRDLVADPNSPSDVRKDSFAEHPSHLAQKVLL